MHKKLYPDEFYDISEKDFWHALLVPAKTPGSDHLRQAIRLGKAGKKTKSYVELNEYHRLALADEWQHIMEEVDKAEEPSPALLKNLFAGRIEVAHGMKFHFKGKIDFTCLDQGGDALLWLQGTGWVDPMVSHFIRTSDVKARRYLMDMVLSFYDSRNKWSQPKASGGHYGYGSLGFAVALFFRIYLGLLHTGKVPAGVTEAIMKYFLGCGRIVFKTTKKFIIHNIHTAGCCSILTASRLLPEFKESTVWKRISTDHLIRHSKASFYPDGCHLERCWGYGAHTLGRLIEIYHDAQRYGGLGSRERQYLANLRNAAKWYAKTSGPGYICPGAGDDNGFDCTYLLEKAQTIFPKDTPLDLNVDRKTSCFMKPSGFGFMRNGDDNDSIYATVSFGDYAGWHAHFDSLSMNVRLGEVSLLEELGRFGSYDHPLDHIFRSPEAHNQLLVDGHPYDSRYQDFCDDVIWHSNESIDFFSACHHAYREVASPDHVTHRTYVAASPLIVRRTVVFVKDPGYFVVMDSVMPENDGFFCRAISGWWHSSRPFKVIDSTTVRTEGKTACLMTWAHEKGLERFDVGWDYDTEVERVTDSRYSLRARRWFSQTHTGINGFTTVIMPFKGKLPKLTVRALKMRGVLYRTDAIEVTSSSGKDRFILNPEKLAGFCVGQRKVRERAVIVLARRRGTSIPAATTVIP